MTEVSEEPAKSNHELW